MYLYLRNNDGVRSGNIFIPQAKEFPYAKHSSETLQPYKNVGRLTQKASVDEQRSNGSARSTRQYLVTLAYRRVTNLGQDLTLC